MSIQATIRRVGYADILRDSHAQALFDAYAAECSTLRIPFSKPNVDLYAVLEASDAVRFFGVYQGEDLIGFGSYVSVISPHFNEKIASAESLFILPEHRPGAVGRRLMRALEDDAQDAGAVTFLYNAPVGSQFAKLLERAHSYVCTYVVYSRRLA